MRRSCFPRATSRSTFLLGGVFAAAVALGLYSTASAQTGGEARVAAGVAAGAEQAEVEYLVRGPLHEAFAEPYVPEPLPATAVPRTPPDPIREVPPRYRPDAESIVWIPGYWAWDDERRDFLWVSGVWRQVPPNHRWVPGYWQTVGTGARRVSGFWAPTDVTEVRYVPQPPESVEEGPTSRAPDDDHFYIPGHWVYVGNDFRWQPGFWSPVHTNWVWVPAQYIWTPRGMVYREGYWDYDLPHRGIVFTPVYYPRAVYTQPRFVYRPRYAIDTGLAMLVHLFVRPGARHYYFGDFYGPAYADVFQPWIVRYRDDAYYDPFYAHYRYAVRREGEVLPWIAEQHQFFVTTDTLQLPRTVADQRTFYESTARAEMDPSVARLVTFAESLDNLVEDGERAFEFRQVEEAEIEEWAEARAPLQELAQQRQQVEATPAEDRAPVDRRPEAATEEAVPTTDETARRRPDAAPAEDAPTEDQPEPPRELPTPDPRPAEEARPAERDTAPAETPAADPAPAERPAADADPPAAERRVEGTPEARMRLPDAQRDPGRQQEEQEEAETARPRVDRPDQQRAAEPGREAVPRATAEEPRAEDRPRPERPAGEPEAAATEPTGDLRALPADRPAAARQQPRRATTPAPQPAPAAPRDAQRRGTPPAPAETDDLLGPVPVDREADGTRFSREELMLREQRLRQQVPVETGDDRGRRAGAVTEMRGDLRAFGPDGVPRMRPTRPEDWPPRRRHPDFDPRVPRMPAGIPTGERVASPLLDAAGGYTPGGAPGVGRGQPDRSGGRSTEARPFTLPDIPPTGGRGAGAPAVRPDRGDVVVPDTRQPAARRDDSGAARSAGGDARGVTAAPLDN